MLRALVHPSFKPSHLHRVANHPQKQQLFVATNLLVVERQQAPSPVKQWSCSVAVHRTFSHGKRTVSQDSKSFDALVRRGIFSVDHKLRTFSYNFKNGQKREYSDDQYKKEWEKDWKGRPGGKLVRLRTPNAAEILVVLNVLIYFLMGDSDAMRQSFSTSIRAISEGKLFTLLSSMFTHGSLMHLAVNSIALFSFRSLVPVIGNRRFLTIYFVSGLIGSLFFLMQYGVQYVNSTDWIGKAMNYNQACCGSSAAICGLFSFLAHLAPQAKVGVMFVLPLPAIRALQLMTVFELIRLIYDIAPQVSASGHLGGIIAGRLLFQVMRKKFVHM